MGKQQFRKVAKKTICWLLILGMLVTLPQFPMTQVSAAEVNTEMIEELDSTELKEVETETTETELSETTEAEGADTEKTAETEEDQDTETEEGEDTEAADSEAAENEAVDEETDVKAATNTDLTVHFKNEGNWEKVYVKAAAGGQYGWDSIPGLEYCNSNYGGILTENTSNAGWYSFKITKTGADTVNGLFNSGAWTNEGGQQTSNYAIEITNDIMEVWITGGNVVSETAPGGWVFGATVTAPVDPATLSNVKSPVLNEDGSVTFNYEISANTLGTEKLYLMGTITDWTTGKEMTDEDGDGVYSITISDKAPGNYEYKFKYGNNWRVDPANSKYSGDNSAVTIPGLGEDTIEAKLGSTTALPATLKMYAEDGTSNDVAPTYTLEENVAGATISGANLVLDNTVTATYIKVTLTASVFPKDTTDKITWKTSNKKVVTITAKGKIKGVKAGTATITATASNGKKATCKVTVKVPATKVKLNKTKVTLAKGKSVTLKATLTPTNSTDKLTWTTSNKKVATVTSKGKVTAVKKGTATITVKTTSGKKATCKVTVK